MTVLEILKILAASLILHLIPGWALLSLGDFRKQWSAIQRWILAFFLGMAVYPVLYYGARVLIPSLQIGLNKLYFFLGLLFLFCLYQYRKDWRDNFNFDKADLIVLGVLIVALFTRLSPILQYNYPAWTDSLHHTIITKIVMQTGKLPFNMLPYDPGDLSIYHLGLYSLTGSVGLLAKTTPHFALVVYAQVLNAMAGLAVFVFLDKMLGRLPALAGMVFVSFISFQPALYFNWGRFTQLAAQTLLLPSALVFWQFLQNTKNEKPQKKKYSEVAPIILVSLTIAATIMLHFRVAVFYVPLLVLLFLSALISKPTSKLMRQTIFLRAFLIAMLSLLLVLPALIPGIKAYLYPGTPQAETIFDPTSTVTSSKIIENPYYRFEYSSFYILGLTKTAMIVVIIGLLAGLCFKKSRPLSLIAMGWTFSLWLIGSLPNLNIQKLAIVNMTGVMILAYLPGAIGFGLLLFGLQQLLDRPFKPSFGPILSWMILFSAIPFVLTTKDTIRPYYHFMRAEDEKAMQWIKANTPQESIIAINPTFWAGGAFHGSDAGYWIPYFAERETTTRTMMSEAAPDFDMVRKRNEAVYKLYETPANLQNLCDLGVDYLYSGNKDPFTRHDFDIKGLLTQENTQLLYDQDNVQILKICP